MFDMFEEFRHLSDREAALRRLARDRLTLFIREKAAYWKQRGKIRNIREGDASTKYFHAHASTKLRHNQIRAVEFGGVVITDQMAKLETFTNYYTTLLGNGTHPSWGFDLHTIYARQQAVDTGVLIAPFTMT
jgi:hypothetical protein